MIFLPYNISIEEMRKSAVPLFIIKTWEMLQAPTHFPTLRWSLQGDSFQITDEARFVEEVLPLYFKHANFSSFIRQVASQSFS
jgi:heat shock transcription factor, other eukaryote